MGYHKSISANTTSNCILVNICDFFKTMASVTLYWLGSFGFMATSPRRRSNASQALSKQALMRHTGMKQNRADIDWSSIALNLSLEVLIPPWWVDDIGKADQEPLPNCEAKLGLNIPMMRGYRYRHLKCYPDRIPTKKRSARLAGLENSLQMRS